MFRGNHPAKVEDSGRIKLPVAFKKSVDEQHVTEFYITSADGKSAEVWPLAEWEKVEQLLAENSTLDDAVQQYMNLTSYYGQQVKMDGQGRIVLPQILREAAKLDGDVAVLGKARYLEIFNMETIQQNLKANEMSKEDRAKVAAIFKPRI
jgi:MraZ protein